MNGAGELGSAHDIMAAWRLADGRRRQARKFLASACIMNNGGKIMAHRGSSTANMSATGGKKKNSSIRMKSAIGVNEKRHAADINMVPLWRHTWRNGSVSVLCGAYLPRIFFSRLLAASRTRASHSVTLAGVALK